VPIVTVPINYNVGSLRATNFKEGYAIVQTMLNPSTWRVINNEGKFVSDELHISFANDFSCGLSCIKEDKGYGYINTNGDMVIEPVFEDADSFYQGYARIVYKGRDGLINTEGKIFWSDGIVKMQRGGVR
jgi:hypothetical protein